MNTRTKPKDPLDEYKEYLAKEIIRTQESIIAKTNKLEELKKKIMELQNQFTYKKQ